MGIRRRLCTWAQHSVRQLPLKLIVPPYFENPNLNAQKGVLSYWQIEMVCRKEEDADLMSANPSYTVDRRQLDILLSEYDEDDYSDGITIMYKIEVTVSECYKMYSSLKSPGYTAARLFPGYNGVAKQIEENKIAESFECSQYTNENNL